MIEIFGVPGLPEITEGDDLAALIAARADLRDGDVLVVTSKIVSKAEGRVLQATDREKAIDSEAVRVVARRGMTRIVETRHGLVMASDSRTNAGHDQVNVARKTHTFVQPGERVFILLSSGRLSCTQSIITLLKRDFAVKDTGSLLFGFGGLLERVDSLLFAAPLGYFAILIADRLTG